MGAVGRSAEIDFEASGISVLQALARAGGVDDNRANPVGVFLFRYEDDNAVPSATPDKLPKVNGKVPTIYQFNLRDPAVFFAAQSFMLQNKDLLYVSNAPSVDVEKVIGLVGSIVYPFASLYNMGIIH
jgi:polysaccharide export outer membrane protein